MANDQEGINPNSTAVATGGPVDYRIPSVLGKLYDQGGFAFHPKADGARGDSVTDDTAALITTEGKATNALVDYGIGSYVVSGPINWGLGVSRRGASRGACVFKSTAVFGTTGANRGIFQFTGTTPYTNIYCEKIGFDLTATVDGGLAKMNAIKQLSGPLQHVKFSDLRFDCPVNHGAILLDALGQNVGSLDLAFRDIWVRNGAVAIGCYVNGAQAGALASGIDIDGLYNLLDAININDDRVVVSAHNGGAGTSELRDVRVTGVYVTTVTGATGACNAVKVDTGVSGFLHGVSVRDVFHFGLAAGFTIQRPISFLIGAGGTMQGISVDTVFGYHTQGITVRTVKNQHNPFTSIRNISLLDCYDAIAGIEVYTSSVGGNDAMTVVEKFSLDMTAVPAGNLPVGVLLTGGAATQGFAGVAIIRDGAINGGSIGISNQHLESGAQSNLGWINVRVEDVTSNGQTSAQFSLRPGTGRIVGCPGYNPLGTASVGGVTNGAYVYTNNDNVVEVLYIAGGTLTTIVKNGITLYTSGTTNVNVPLEPGESVTINNTVVPALTVDKK